MIEKALKGNRSYWLWIAFLLVIIALSLSAYSRQQWFGLTVTGMGRDISWGLYNAQFTFLAGVAASAVLVLSGYFHNQKSVARTVVIGKFIAVSATLMSLLFIMADMGRPYRMLNILLYPSPHSLLYWEVLLLFGYLLLNLASGWAVLGAEKKGVQLAAWINAVIYLSIPWAFTLLIVTALLHAGMHGRPLWLMALFVPRFLASVFASATALLILVTFIMKRIMGFDTGTDAQEKLGVLTSYAGFGNIILLGMEFLTTFNSSVPVYRENLQYLFFGLAGNYLLVPWMWFSLIAGVASFTVLLVPALRKSTKWFVAASAGVVLSIWIDLSVGMIPGGFVPSQLGEIVDYFPTSTEMFITLGLWSIGILLLTLLLKVLVAVKAEDA
jgi:Ni/Fe-hydrogenase subunit HybB-like protein